MKAIILFCSVLFCSAVSFSQVNSELLLPEGYSIQTPLSNVSNIGFNNPSFLSRFNGISAGLSYQYGSSLEEPFTGFTGKSNFNGLPYSAALSYQTGDFHLAVALTQRYNLKLQSTNGVGIYILNPDGTRKVVNLSNESDIHDYSVLSSYRIMNLPDGNSLSLGLKLSLGVLRYYSHFDAPVPLPSLKFSNNAMSFALGADYSLAFSKGNLNIGAYFEKGQDFQGDVQVEQNGNRNATVQVDASTPDDIRLDFLLDLQKIQIMAGVSQIFWHSVDKELRNNLDFNTMVSYKAQDWLSVYLGAFITDRQYVNNYISDRPENNALFLTLGAGAALGNYTFGFSVSDSHMTSADNRKQTIGRLTLGYQF